MKKTIFIFFIFLFCILITEQTHIALANAESSLNFAKEAILLTSPPALPNDFFKMEKKIPYLDRLLKLKSAFKEKAQNKLPFLSKLKFSGYLKNETAYRMYEPRTFTKMRNIIYLDTRFPVNSNVSFTLVSWAYYDMVYNFFDYDTIANRIEREPGSPLTFYENLATEKDTPVASIRELYLDIFLENADIRIGKQYVIWGVLEGQRVTDEINPMDFRELILPDLLDFRIALWTLKVNYFWNDSTFEFLWIPDIKPHKPAPRGSEWELLQEVPDTVYRKSFDLKNSEAGFKFSSEIFNTEFALSYFYTWDDFPVVFRVAFLDNSGREPIFFPMYERIHMYGATVVRKLWRFILRGEAVYVTDKFFGTSAVDDDNDGILDNFGEFQKDHIRWGAGFDVNVFGMDFSPSIIQWLILDYEEAIAVDNPDTSFAIFARKEFPQESLVFQVLLIYLITLDESLVKPKLTYNMTDKFQISVGLDLFYGKRSQFGLIFERGSFGTFIEVEDRFQFLGNFNDSDRIYMEFKYNF